MGISETKKQIVIDNYFKNTCDVNISIKEAFTKGFEVGLTKAVFPKDQKSDIVAILDKIKGYIDHIRNTGMGKKKSLEFIEKFIEGLKVESEEV